MITLPQARDLLSNCRFDCPTEYVYIDHALHRTLAIDIHADRPLPPFDRVAMDGIAIASESFEKGVRLFRREAQQFAGEPRVMRSSEPDSTIETSTGAILPGNCDAIIPYEWLEETDGAFKFIEDRAVVAGMNIHAKGKDLASGTKVLEANQRIDATSITALASVGIEMVPVKRMPRVAIITTGDELVAVFNTPQEHQIRQSNGYTIRALLKPLGIEARLYHLNDSRTNFRNWINNHRAHYDLMIFTGGVSKGKRDYLPQVLEGAGIEALFHRVAQRPGKPIWFGGNGSPYVFGLPGNPVSSAVATLIYIRPWIEMNLGAFANLIDEPKLTATLEKSVTFKPNLTLFQPVNVRVVNAQVVATPVQTNGSGDFISLREATGVVELPEGETLFEARRIVNYYPFEWIRN